MLYSMSILYIIYLYIKASGNGFGHFGCCESAVTLYIKNHKYKYYYKHVT